MSLLTTFLILFSLISCALISSAHDITTEFSTCSRKCMSALVSKTEDFSDACAHSSMCKCSFKTPDEDPCSHTVRFARSLRELKRRRRGVSKELPRLEITQEPPNSLQVQIGSSATITCLAESESTKNIGYSWTFTNSSKMIEKIDQSVLIKTNILILMEVSKNNTGWFQCDASDGSNHALSRKTRVLPVYFDDEFIEEPSDTKVNDGTLQLTLECQPPLSYPAPQVYWTKNGALLTDTNALQTPNGGLYIHHVTTANAGAYACNAVLEDLIVNGTVAKRTSRVANLVVAGPAVVPGNYLPTAVWNDNQMYLEKGDNVTINCGVYGNPTPEILWYKGLQTKISGNSETFPRVTISANQYQLTIENLQLSDTAQYMCISKNLLDLSGLPISTNIYVVSDLRFSIPLVDKSLVKGDTFVLICKVAGNPPVTIDWYADGQKIVKQRNHVSWKDEVEDSPTGEYSVQSTLTITGATVEDTGLYQCIANNDHQNIVDTASIFISSVLEFEAAHFITPITMYVEDTQSGIIRCGAKGSPMPDVNWVNLPTIYQSSMPVEGTIGLSSTKHIEFPIGPLFINNSETINLKFTCLTSNSYAGQDYKALHVISVFIGYPVEFVSAPTVVEVDKGGSNVMECVFSGLPTPKITWQRNGVDLPIYNSDGSFNHVIKDDGALLIMKSTSSDDTMFTCIGTNGFNSDWGQLQVIVINSGLSVAAGSGIGIGLLLIICLIILIMAFIWKRTKDSKVEPEEKQANGIDTVTANAKALAKLRKEEEAKLIVEQKRLEEEERKKAEEEILLQEEEERKKRVEEQRIQEEAEAKRLEEEVFAQEAAREAEEERIRIEEEGAEKARQESEEKTRLDAEEAARIAAIEKARLNEEERMKKEAEEEAARVKAEEEEKVRIEAEEKARIEEEERVRKEEEMKAKMDAEEREKFEAEQEKARLEAEEQARIDAEEAARVAEEQRLQALQIAEMERLEKERLERERLRLEEEERERLEKERFEEEARLQQLEMEKMAKLEEERLERERTRLEEEKKARLEEEEKARLEALEQARLEEEEKQRIEAERIANLAAEDKARAEAEELARILAVEKARVEAEEKAQRIEVERLRMIELANLQLMEEEKRQAEEARLQKIETERLQKLEEERIEKEKIRMEEEIKVKAAAEAVRIKAEEEARHREQEERIRLMQEKEEEEMMRRQEAERLRLEQFEDEQEAERKAAEKQAEREEALRKLEADTALANAQQENATRIQVDVHKKNQSSADKEYDAAVAAEEEADKAVRESKSDKEREIANRIRDGAMNRTTRAGLNKDLADATITRDPQKLKPAIKKAEKKKVSGTENYLLQAKKLYEQLQTATQLKGATFDRRIADIEAAIHAIKKGGFETLLAVELLEAQVLLKKLKRIQKAALEVQSLSQQTIAIMKSYNRPPDVVVQVMRAVFLLLGHPSSELSAWSDIVIQLNKTGKENTKRRIQCRVPEDISYMAAKKTELILCKYDEELVFDTTQALGVFYNWAECIADERLALPEILTEKHKSSGLFGNNAPPLPSMKSSLTAANAVSQLKKKKPKGEEASSSGSGDAVKGKKKKKGSRVAGDLRIGAQNSPIPAPPKFLYNGT